MNMTASKQLFKALLSLLVAEGHMSISLVITRSVCRGLPSGSAILVTLFIPSTRANIGNSSSMEDLSWFEISRFQSCGLDPLLLSCGEGEHPSRKNRL